MKKGEKFEVLAKDYLSHTLSPYGVTVNKIGGSNSTKTDIVIKKSDTDICNIECKESISQSSQFVVKKDHEEGNFNLSDKNKSQPTEASHLIVEHMNNHSKHYSAVSLNNKQVDLLCSTDLMYEHICSDLSNKSDFIITATKSGISLLEESLERNAPWTNGLLIKISQIKEVFDVSGKYRIKTSGTRKATANHIKDSPLKIREIDRSYYVHDRNNSLPKYQSNGLYLSPSGEKGLRKVKKTSETKNANVIFSLKIKSTIKMELDISDLHKFIDDKIRG